MSVIEAQQEFFIHRVADYKTRYLLPWRDDKARIYAYKRYHGLIWDEKLKNDDHFTRGTKTGS